MRACLPIVLGIGLLIVPAELHAQQQPVVAALIRKLQDPDSRIKSQAAWALGRIGPAAGQAIPALLATMKEDEAEVSAAAAGAIREIQLDHPQVTSFILGGLECPEPATRLRALKHLRNLIDPVRSVQKGGGHALAGFDEFLKDFGPAATRIMPDLIACLKDPDVRVRPEAIELFTGLGPAARQARDALMPLLDDAFGKEARLAALALVHTADEGPEGVAFLLGLAARPGERLLSEVGFQLEMRFSGVRGNQDLPEVARSVPVLIATLRDRSPAVRALTAYCLWRIGSPLAKSASDALKVALDDPDEETRLSAAGALLVLDAGNEKARAVVEKWLAGRPSRGFALRPVGSSVSYPFYNEMLRILGRDKTPERVAELIRTMEAPPAQISTDNLEARGELEQIGPIAVPGLLERLKNAPPHFAMQYGWILLSIRPFPREGIAPLAELLHDPEAKRRVEAARVLAAVGPVVKPAEPELAKALQDAEPEVRIRAAQALLRIGHDSRAVVPVLVRIMDDPRSQWSGLAAEALLSVGPETAIPRLTHALRVKHRGWGGAAILDALDRADATGRAAMDAVAAMLRDPDVEIRRNAIFVLMADDIDLKPHRPALEAALEDADWLVSPRAAYLLRKLQPDHQAAMDRLLKGLAGNDQAVREESLLMVRMLGENARPAIPALKGILNDREERVRDEALLAIWHLAPLEVPPQLVERVLGLPDPPL